MLGTLRRPFTAQVASRPKTQDSNPRPFGVRVMCAELSTDRTRLWILGPPTTAAAEPPRAVVWVSTGEGAEVDTAPGLDPPPPPKRAQLMRPPNPN